MSAAAAGGGGSGTNEPMVIETTANS